MGTPAKGPHFIGPGWDHDGQPILVESLDGRKGRSHQRHLQRTIVVMDDFGNAVCYLRSCATCWEHQPLRFENYHAHAAGTLGMNSRCNQCSIVHNVGMRRANPERHKAGMRRRYRDRMQSDPAYRARVKAKAKAAHERRKATMDPEERRRRDRESARRYRQKLMRDPERLARFRETQRMANRLRKERDKGINVLDLRKGGHRSMPADISRKNSLPAIPLANAIRVEAAKREVDVESLCVQLGFPSRALSRWKTSGDGASIMIADQVMVGLDLCWWDIWTPDDPDTHEKARLVFEADDLRRAA